MRLAAQGLPVVVVNPAHVFGTGDLYRSSTELVRRFLRRQIPAYVDGALNVVDADDVARGQLLADERGVVGERYILGNRNFTLDRLLRRPRAAVRRRAAGGEAAGRRGDRAGARRSRRRPARRRSPPASCAPRRCGGPSAPRRPGASSGWKPSHHEDTLVTTIEWYRSREPLRLRPPGTRQPAALRLAGFGLRTAGGVISRLTPSGPSSALASSSSVPSTAARKAGSKVKRIVRPAPAGWSTIAGAPRSAPRPSPYPERRAPPCGGWRPTTPSPARSTGSPSFRTITRAAGAEGQRRRRLQLDGERGAGEAQRLGCRPRAGPS